LAPKQGALVEVAKGKASEPERRACLLSWMCLKPLKQFFVAVLKEEKGWFFDEIFGHRSSRVHW
jgi:hypothetical protein